MCGAATHKADLLRLKEVTSDAVLVTILNVRLWPILLKKSAMICVSEKYASEIEIFTFG